MRRRASARGLTGVMITPDDIARLANEGESEMLEFKSTTGSRVSAAQTLSAMLNGQGGRVLFGVRPDGRVVGQHVSDNTLQLVTQACRDIRPRHPPLIERVRLPNASGLEVLVAAVPAGNSKPYSHKGRFEPRVSPLIATHFGLAILGFPT